MSYLCFVDYDGYRIGTAANAVDKLWRGVLTVGQSAKGIGSEADVEIVYVLQSHLASLSHNLWWSVFIHCLDK